MSANKRHDLISNYGLTLRQQRIESASNENDYAESSHCCITAQQKFC